LTKIYEDTLTKIALPSNGRDLSAIISDKFGRCPYFIIVDIPRLEEVTTLVNDAQRALGDAGIQAAQSLVNKQVQVVITPQIGSHAWDVLQNACITIYRSFRGSVKKNIELYTQGRLNEMNMARGAGPGMAMCRILHLMNDQR
jgi:predicted Fe-Mo cluster-binding NifX family protein